jgi:DNA-binding transcriptional MerR regulator
MTTTTADNSNPPPKRGDLATISDLAREFQITPRAIRFYESRGLIEPQRRGSQRLYSRRDRARLNLIVRGRNLGFTLEDVAKYLELYDADPTQLAQTQMLLEKVELAITDLEGKRRDIERALSDLGDIRQQCVDHLSRSGS